MTSKSKTRKGDSGIRMTETAVETDSPRKIPRPRLSAAVATFAAALVIWAGWAWSSAHRHRNAMIEIRSQMAAGRFAVAATNLLNVIRSWPSSDEAAYLLGVCEQQQGQAKAALRAWARVEPGSPNSERALQSTAQVLFNSGQLSATEKFVDEACQDSRNERTGVRALLIPLFRQVGRIDDAKRLVEDRWQYLSSIGQGANELALRMVQMHIELTDNPPSLESVRAYIEHAARQAPDDDRVWLSRANLAIRLGDHAEAQRWLDACQTRRPDDVPVWEARLRWAMATNRVKLVQEATRHLPVNSSIPGQIHRIAAWYRKQAGDVPSERRELERLIAAEPADLAAHERLALLAEADGQRDQAADYRRLAARVHQSEARYKKLYERKQPVRHAIQLAHLANELGRHFEARGFLTLAVAENRGRDDLKHKLKRLIETRGRPARTSQSLADALAQELKDERQSSEREAHQHTH